MLPSVEPEEFEEWPSGAALFRRAVLLYTAAILNAQIALACLVGPVRSYVYVGPFLISSAATISTLVSFVIMILLLRVVGADRREKYRLAAEFEAARGVQHLLLQPGAGSLEYPVDAVYLPASEVGGDFYQQIEDGEGGSQSRWATSAARA
jgi:hypothetical protein